MSENLELFPSEPPPVTAATWPTDGTQAAKALHALLTAPAVTQARYHNSWRLAAYVNALKNTGWAISSRLITMPNGTAHIAEYRLDRTDPATAAAIRQRGAA